VPRRFGDLGDRGNQSRAISKRINAVVGVRAPEQNTPIIDATGIMERPRRGSLVGHLTISSAIFCGHNRPVRLDDNLAGL
jgi:hypothetical protein